MSVIREFFDKVIEDSKVEKLQEQGFEDSQEIQAEIQRRDSEIEAIDAHYEKLIDEEKARFLALGLTEEDIRIERCKAMYNAIRSSAVINYIKGTKKAIGQQIKWTSSRFNEVRKPELVKIIYDVISIEDQSIFYSENQSGSYSAAAHGYGPKSQRFVPKTYGTDCNILSIGKGVILFWSENSKTPSQVIGFAEVDYPKSFDTPHLNTIESHYQKLSDLMKEATDKKNALWNN